MPHSQFTHSATANNLANKPVLISAALEGDPGLRKVHWQWLNDHRVQFKFNSIISQTPCKTSHQQEAKPLNSQQDL